MTAQGAVGDVLNNHGVSRLCHFTPSRNLPHIFRDGQIRATQDLDYDVRAVYNPTDLARLDGHRDRICCTIQYPNAYYWAQAKDQGEARLFPDWVVILLNPDIAADPGTLFCTGNAARQYGATARPGSDGLLAAYAPSVVGSGGRTFSRGPSHLPACPTDLQAEVLVPGPVPMSSVSAIVVGTSEQAETEVARLTQLSLPTDRVAWVVAPLFFQRYQLASAIQRGVTPAETKWSRKEEQS